MEDWSFEQKRVLLLWLFLASLDMEGYYTSSRPSQITESEIRININNVSCIHEVEDVEQRCFQRLMIRPLVSLLLLLLLSSLFYLFSLLLMILVNSASSCFFSLLLFLLSFFLSGINGGGFKGSGPPVFVLGS